MSGHNKWSKIKNKKGAEDAKRGAIFMKLSREIYVAAKNGGGDVSMNAALRLAVDKAKAANMPNDNVQRAIKKATETGASEHYDEIVYEGYGPGGVAILVYTLTDNKNRTDTNIHVAFSRNGGNQGTSGSVSYQFHRKGTLLIDRSICSLTEDEMFEKIIEAGAEDLVTTDESFEIITDPKEFTTVRDSLMEEGIEFAHAELAMIPDNTVALDDEKREKLERLIDKLEEDDDVQNVYTNVED